MTPDEQWLTSFHAALWPGNSPDPEHPDNRDNHDWLDGYAEGFAHGTCRHRSITPEWYLRGYEIDSMTESQIVAWKSWKLGFHAGGLKRAMDKARESVAAK